MSNAEQYYLYSLLEQTSTPGISGDKVIRISNALKQIYKQHETVKHPESIVPCVLQSEEPGDEPELQAST